MATRARPIVRVFRFNGMTLEDPFPGKSLTVVRRVHQTMHSAITNAKLDGPDFEGNQEVYTYRVRAGTNG